MVEYLHARCPNCLAFGVLHDDHEDHLHYHLMISANERQEAKRFRLTRSDFSMIKRQIEELCLSNFPELKQDMVQGRGGKIVQEVKQELTELVELSPQQKPSKTQELTQQIEGLMQRASSPEDFEKKLEAIDFRLYQRGKHY